MAQSTLNYRSVLLQKYDDRKRDNRLYSLRTFARELGITPSRLSEILSGKTGLSANKAAVIAQRLQMPESEANQFIDLVESEHARSKVSRDLARQRLSQGYEPPGLTLEQLRTSQNCLCILANLSSVNAPSSTQGLALACDLSEEMASATLALLQNLQLVENTPTGWIRGNQSFY